jgi:asparagine synthase (glutamine-hydrolysing)
VRLVKPAVFTLADRFKWPLFIKGKKYIKRASISYHERLSSYSIFKSMPISQFFEDKLLDIVGKEYDPHALISYYYFEAPADNNLDRHLYVDWRLTLSDNDIIKVTRATEAAGIVVRYPFLDNPLVEFAVTVPANIRMRGLRLRAFQKKAYSDLLPKEIRSKRKHGFGLPISGWLRTDKQLKEMMVDLVLGSTVRRGYFKHKAIEELLRNHQADSTSFYGPILWGLMILELWLQTHSH